MSSRERRVYEAWGVGPLARALAQPHPRIALVACAAAKRPAGDMAAFLYAPSDLFSKSLTYAGRTCHAALILSAKHGLVPPTAWVEPYNETLAGAPVARVREWSARVSGQLPQLLPAERPLTLVALAGSPYVRELRLPAAWRLETPLARLGLGARKGWLRAELARLNAEGTGAPGQEGGGLRVPQ